jgi:hypothetical protein
MSQQSAVQTRCALSDEGNVELWGWLEDALEFAAWLTGSWRRWFFLSMAAAFCGLLAFHSQLLHAGLLP